MPLAHTLLALTLALPSVAPAQAPFPIPVPPSVVVGPALLLLIPWAVSRGDGNRIRELQTKGDWDGLAALASARLDKQPEALQWRRCHRSRPIHVAARAHSTPDLAFGARRGGSAISDPITARPIEAAEPRGARPSALVRADARRDRLRHAVGGRRPYRAEDRNFKRPFSRSSPTPARHPEPLSSSLLSAAAC
jgi:hypothetical protein